MEHYTKRTNIICEFTPNDQNTNTTKATTTTITNSSSSPRLSYKSHPSEIYDNILYSPSRSSTTSVNNSLSLLPPPTPDSPWTLSPHPTPSPTLLHHCIASLHRHDGTIFSVAASKGLVFTGTESRRVRAWRQLECTEKGYLKSKSGEVRAILAHGNTIFTSHKDFKVRIWNTTPNSETFKAKKITTLPKKSSFILKFAKVHMNNPNKHRDCISCMAYNQAEGILYTGSWDKTVKAWRVSDGKCVDSFIAHEDNINAIVINQNDGCVFTCSSDGSVKIWRRVYGQSTHTLTMTLRFQLSPVNALALSSSSSSASCFLYSGSSDGFVNFWEKEKNSGRFNHGGFLQGHRFAVLCLVAIEKLVFSGSEDTTIRIWRREEGSYFHECLAVLDAHRGPVKCLAASLEIEKVMVMGFLVYSAGLDQTFKVWRIKVLPDQQQDHHQMLLDHNHNQHQNQSSVGVANVMDQSTKKIVKNGNGDGQYEMSPVLSPSWVEKKLQGINQIF